MWVVLFFLFILLYSFRWLAYRPDTNTWHTWPEAANLCIEWDLKLLFIDGWKWAQKNFYLEFDPLRMAWHLTKKKEKSKNKIYSFRSKSKADFLDIIESWTYIASIRNMKRWQCGNINFQFYIDRRNETFPDKNQLAPKKYPRAEPFAIYFLFFLLLLLLLLRLIYGERFLCNLCNLCLRV